MNPVTRCYAVCHSDSYDILAAKSYFKELNLKCSQIDNVLYVSIPILGREEEYADVFLFYFGSLVIWNSTPQEEKSIQEEILKFAGARSPEAQPTNEVIKCKYNPEAEKSYVDEEEDYVLLNTDNIFTKFAVSYALAQSVKLSYLESAVSYLLNSTSKIQKELSQNGSTSLSKKEISRKIGQLFSQRYAINLHNDILDIPEFFWSRPTYEQLYLLTARYQDVQPRQNTLNRRIDMIHDLYEILSNDLNYKHSSRLEVIIISLIAIEIVINVVHLIIFN